MGQADQARTEGTREAVLERTELGHALRDLRERQERSLPVVAHHGYRDDVRLDPGQIGQYERGQKRPTYRTLCAILDGIGLPREELPWIVRLQLVRGQLEPSAVGLNEAEANLARVESVLLSREEAPETPSPTLRDAAEEADRHSSESRGTPSVAGTRPAAPVSRQRRSA
jgi:transcriptional regulator with XRE-family HTH domain